MGVSFVGRGGRSLYRTARTAGPCPRRSTSTGSPRRPLPPRRATWPTAWLSLDRSPLSTSTSDFAHLTVARMLDQTTQAVAAVAQPPSGAGGVQHGGYVWPGSWPTGDSADALILLALDLADLWSNEVSEADRARWQRDGFWPWAPRFQAGRAAALRLLQGGNHHPGLSGHLRVPTLIIHGTYDTVVPIRHLGNVRPASPRHPTCRTAHRPCNWPTPSPAIWDSIQAFLPVCGGTGGWTPP